MHIYIDYCTHQRHNLQWGKVLGMDSLITVYFMIVCPAETLLHFNAIFQLSNHIGLFAVWISWSYK